MRAKTERRLQAEALRREQGLSYKEIRGLTGTSLSTLPHWLKDIELSPEHEQHLQARLRANRGAFAARALPINRQRYARARSEAYAAGAALVTALTNSPTEQELALAMLYLGEGSKTGGRVQMANADPAVMRFFLGALRRCYTLEEHRLSFRLNLVPAAETSAAALTA